MTITNSLTANNFSLQPALFEVLSFRTSGSTLRDNSFIHSYGYDNNKALGSGDQAVILANQPSS